MHGCTDTRLERHAEYTYGYHSTLWFFPDKAWAAAALRFSGALLSTLAAAGGRGDVLQLRGAAADRDGRLRTRQGDVRKRMRVHRGTLSTEGRTLKYRRYVGVLIVP